MSKTKVCISFEYTNDKRYRYLLDALDANPNINLSIDDVTPDEINSSDIARIKGVLTTRISEAKCLVVLSGDYINSRHKDATQIGCINWQNWECKKALELNKKIILVKLSTSSEVPNELYGHTSMRIDINGFDVNELIKAINQI